MAPVRALTVGQDINGLDVNAIDPLHAGCGRAMPVMSRLPRRRRGPCVDQGRTRRTSGMPGSTRSFDDIVNPKRDLLRMLRGSYWCVLTSDHPGVPSGWMRTVVGRENRKRDWEEASTGTQRSFFVFWDDWGGFYDHVKPYVVRDAGRSRLSAYHSSSFLLILERSKKPSHTLKIEFATLLKFTEDNVGDLPGRSALPMTRRI